MIGSHLNHQLLVKEMAVVACVSAAMISQAATTAPAHLVAARQLVAGIVAEGIQGNFKQPDGNLVNSYGGNSATNYLQWSPIALCYARCSSFLSMVLEYSYPGWTPSGAGLTSKSPTAATYHDAIADNANGFANIPVFENIQAGDLLVVKNLDGSGDSGHVMMVDSWTETIPNASNVKTWMIRVIDCADSGHSNDTRNVLTSSGTIYTTGAGAGTIQVFTNAGVITGHTWSTSRYSTIYTPTQRNVVLGRFLMGA